MHPPPGSGGGFFCVYPREGLFDFGKGFATVTDMKREIIRAGIFAGLAVLGCALFAGCGRASAERREARDRYLRRAQAAQESQDIDRAIALCEQALLRRPDLALAHRELGLMLDNYRRDYVPAIYHYQRYLQLRPDAKNREEIDALIRQCRMSFAAQIAESPEEIKLDLQARDARIRNLELEVAAWREQNNPVPAPAAAASASLAKAAASPAVSPAVSAQAQFHVVQAGENLATISMRYYGTRAKWKTIFDANKERLTDANNLRVGTKLDIPRE